MQKIIVSVIAVISALFVSCSPTLDNSVTIKNIAQEAVNMNIFGRIINVKSGATQTIKYVQKGTYSYSITYVMPSVATTSSVEGNADGEVTMEAGTKISFLFASRLQAATTGGSGTNQLAYVLIISVSTSDRNNTGTGGITD